MVVNDDLFDKKIDCETLSPSETFGYSLCIYVCSYRSVCMVASVPVGD